jgi:hypothetical protein
MMGTLMKIGDKVKFINKKSVMIPFGSTGIITDILNDFVVSYNVDYGDTMEIPRLFRGIPEAPIKLGILWCDESELELVVEETIPSE